MLETVANSARHMPLDPFNPLHCRIDFLLLRVLPFGFISTPHPIWGSAWAPFLSHFRSQRPDICAIGSSSPLCVSQWLVTANLQRVM